MKLYKYQAALDGADRTILSIFPPDKVNEDGLSSMSVVGYYINPALPLSPDNVKINPFFTHLLQKIIGVTIPHAADFRSAVEQQQHGRISVVDLRVEDGEEIRAEDVAGHFEILDGEVILQYQPNPEYQLISARGVFKMEQEIEDALMEEAAV